MTLHPEFLSRPIAHRGLHDVNDGRPENSRAAIRAAIAGGYGIEIDLQLSADGSAMVFHDYALDRLTGRSGALGTRDAAQLQQIPLLGGNENIPSFAEVLKLVNGQVPLLVEVKDQDGQMGANIGKLEAAAADAIRGYAGPLAVMSFNPHSIAEMSRLLPDVPRGLVTSAYRPEDWPLPDKTCEHLRDIPDYDRVGACFISHEVNDLSRPRVAELRARGAQLLCWTVKNEAVEQQAREIAQNITFEGYLARHLT